MTMNFGKRNITNLLYSIGFFLIVLCSFIVRAHHVPEISDLLWSEDGAVFMANANDWGGLSFFKEYAGYSNLSARLAAYISSFLALKWQPFSFLVWVALYYTLSAYLIYSTLTSRKIASYFSFIICIFIFVQPLPDEIVLNLVNTQWFLGAATIIYTLGYEGINSKYKNIILAIFLGLSGPFSLILLPFLLFKVFFQKIQINRDYYFTFMMTAVVQFGLYLTSSSRGNSGISHSIPTFHMIGEGGKAIAKGFIYGADDKKVWLTCICILFCLLYLVLSSYFQRNNNQKSQLCFFTELVLAGILINVLTFISLFGKKPEMFQYQLASLETGNRYFFIPHSLFIVGIMTLAFYNRVIRILLIFCFLFLSWFFFVPIHRDATHFQSFNKFSEYTKTYIPFNPLELQPIHVQTPKAFAKKSYWIMDMTKPSFKTLDDSKKILLMFSDIKENNSSVSKIENGFKVNLTGGGTLQSRLVEFERPLECNATSDLGITFKIKASDSIRLNFFLRSWDKGELKSKAFIVEDDTQETLQIAFPYDGQKSRLSMTIDPVIYAGKEETKPIEVEFQNVTLFCLPQ